MKKALSVILAVILMFSAVSVMAFAEDGTEATPAMVTVKFYWDAADLDGEAKNVVQIAAGENLVEHFNIYDCRPEVPVKESTETTKYTFDCWEEYTLGTDGKWIATGKTAYTGTLPAIPEDAEDGSEIIYVATYYEEEIKENVSFWALIASIFARFNVIFEYFAKVFEGVIEF